MDEDRINKNGTKAKCRTCGVWYSLDEAHGMYSSPDHVAALLAENLKRQIAARGIDGSDLLAALAFAQSVGRGADYLEKMDREKEAGR